ncbi:Maf family protein [Candidatus Protochlamydia amoebophila]|uniref:Maf family protein n=1 Tax=Candidatus Protochlamydia amoebophila TaxID=362787 RepID=UPI001BC9E250|nr:nucleoside triphosphate pyrophosphatase [Candidatus Protochlamydia amoebophila]
MKIILGSQSPRRKEILNFFSLPFEQVSPVFDEETVPFGGNPEHYVLSLSAGKTKSLRYQFPKDILISADTIVYKEGKVFGKPRSKEEAFQNLRELAGHWHSVYTGVNVSNETQVIQQFEETKVLFNSLTDDEIHQYQERIHCADKAGGYMIQGAGSLIIKKLEGCYYNVMGLPINTLRLCLSEIGINLWKYLKDR